MCMQNLWPQLMTEKEEAKLYRALQAEQEHLECMVAEGCAALPLLEAKLMSAACDDPGPVIMDRVVLPLLRQRLTAKAEALLGSGSTSQVYGCPFCKSSVRCAPYSMCVMCWLHYMLLLVSMPALPSSSACCHV